MNKAIFLDRDGTIIFDRHFIKNPYLVELIPGVVEGLSLFKKHGFLLIMVSNQSGIARGFFGKDKVEAVNSRMAIILKENDIYLDGSYYCPHSPDDKCNCRKPAIGMAIQARDDFNIDLTGSYMIGDKPSDIQFGTNFGAKISFFSIKDAFDYFMNIS